MSPADLAVLTDWQIDHLYRLPQSERAEAVRRGPGGGPPLPPAEPPPGYKPDRAAYVRTAGEFLGWSPERAGQAWDEQWGAK